MTIPKHLKGQRELFGANEIVKSKRVKNLNKMI
jgi:hypothetical protein